MSERVAIGKARNSALNTSLGERPVFKRASTKSWLMHSCCLVTGSLVLSASIASAQTAPPTVLTPLTVEPDINHVNLSTGLLNIDVPTLSVPADPHLKFDKVQNLAIYVVGSLHYSATTGEFQSSDWSYHYGGEGSESFHCSQMDICHSVVQTGSIGDPDGHFLTRAPSGIAYSFPSTLSASNATCGTGCNTQSYYGQVIGYPGGETITLTYDSGSTNGTFIDHRPTMAVSSTGYYIKIKYQTDTLTDATVGDWFSVKEADLYGPGGVLLQWLTITPGTTTDTVTDWAGRVYQLPSKYNVVNRAPELAAGTIQLPGETSQALSLVTDSNNPPNLLKSLVRDGVTWNYSYSQPAFGTTFSQWTWAAITVAGPNGYRMTYNTQSAPPSGVYNEITSKTDALNRTTTYTYDPTSNRITHIDYPEHNSVDLTYGPGGNIITKTTHAKPNTGLPDLVESATYTTPPAGEGCDGLSYPVLCWRPLTYTDALQRTTNYFYNNMGQVTGQFDPPDQAGIRRETDIQYEAHTTANGGGISRPILVRVCGTTAAPSATTTCSGTAASHTEYTYWTDTLLPLTVTQKDEVTGATRTTTYTYDPSGRVTMIDGPLSGTDDAKYFYYDTAGRKVWEISEAAANGTRIGQHTTYRDSDNKATSVQTGKANCTTACDTMTASSLAFSALYQTTNTTYDSRRYAIREQTYDGASNTQLVTDRSFLDLGLADCTAVRMNFGALPLATATGACTLSTTGTFGPDRITKNLYDNVGQLTKIQKAYGVTTANGFPSTLQQDYATYTYTPNGKQQTVTDANGNLAKYAYDGYDRLQYWYFPSKTAAGSNSTCDYEQYGYDAVGNRTSLRKRDGSILSYTYDNMNRVISKAGTVGSVVCP